MKNTIALLVCVFWVFAANAQTPRIEMYKGNKAYGAQDYDAALQRYDAALEKGGDNNEARFNRANSMLRKAEKMAGQVQGETAPNEEQQQLMEMAKGLNDRAATDFESIARITEESETRNKAYFNQGNAHLYSGEIDKSIEAYKNALRANPGDNDARHNLAFAMRMKQQQEQQDEQQQDQQDNQEQQDQEKKENNENQDKQDQEQQQPEEPEQMSAEEAEQMLDAMQQREKELQEELNKRKQKTQRITIEKDW